MRAEPTDAAPAPEGPQGKRPVWHYVSPYTGEVLDAPKGESFFRTTMQIHRWLAAGDFGKHIVGASTVALLFLASTGLYLRWPARTRDWRVWTYIDRALRGRAFLYRLHAVVGTWVLPMYLAAALTGLTWSYEWYRAGFYSVLGATPPARPGAPASADGARPASPVPPLDAEPALRVVWPVVVAEAGPLTTATVSFPDNAMRPIEIRYLAPDAAHERATNRLAVDPLSGAIVAHERYLDKPLGARLAGSIFPLHRGSFFGATGTIFIMIASLLMPLFAVTGLMMYLERRKFAKQRDAVAATSSARVTAA